jgi:hypothetical protein
MLRLDELQPADVLFSRGTSAIADAVVASDGASYSHVALWTGESVVEAVLEGIFERDLQFTRDVYRHRGDQHGPLPREITERATAFARQQVGLPYAYSEIYLLGMLYTHGIHPERSVLEAALELLGGSSARTLSAWLEKVRPTREPMVCSELVARAFYEAEASHQYSLSVLARSERPTALPQRVRARSLLEDVAHLPWAPGDVDIEQLAALSANCSSLLAQPQPGVEPGRERKLLYGTVAHRAGSGRGLGHVTPGDLQFSPSLAYVGTVEPTHTVSD